MNRKRKRKRKKRRAREEKEERLIEPTRPSISGLICFKKPNRWSNALYHNAP